MRSLKVTSSKWTLLPLQTPNKSRNSPCPLRWSQRMNERVSRSRLWAEGVEVSEVQPIFEPVISSVPQSLEWELDFCSRPLLDERKKKIWELLICDSERNFEYAQYFPNNKINSAELKKAIENILKQEGAQTPRKVKFFRAQMKTIISRALEDLDIDIIPSRRCFTLASWLSERMESVYPDDPRYSSEVKPLFTFEMGPPEPLPDNLKGEAWDFVQLPLRTLMNECKDVESGDIFGAVVDPKQAGLDDLPGDTLVPGVSVYSRRAEAIAAWMSGLELCRLTADTDRCCMILETGISDTWRYSSYRPTKEATLQAKAWERAKSRTKGLHFLTIQDNPESEYCFGLWLMMQNDQIE